MLHLQAGDGVVTGKDEKASRRNRRSSDRKRRPFQRDIRDVIAIKVAFNAGMPPAERRQGIRVGIAIEIIEVDLNSAPTQV